MVEFFDEVFIEDAFDERTAKLAGDKEDDDEADKAADKAENCPPKDAKKITADDTDGLSGDRCKDDLEGLQEDKN